MANERRQVGTRHLSVLSSCLRDTLETKSNRGCGAQDLAGTPPLLRESRSHPTNGGGGYSTGHCRLAPRASEELAGVTGRRSAGLRGGGDVAVVLWLI